MRKIKKINGFLVVKFNDREKREYEDAVGWSAIEAGYKTALRGSRKFTREAVVSFQDS